MPDYSKTLIYKLINYDFPDLVYVGSTTNFVKRKQQHKSRCNNENGKGYHTKVYKTIRDNGGWESWNMIVVHEFPCLNKTESAIEEDRCMIELKANMQMLKAYNSEEYKIEQVLKLGKKYRMKNKDILTEKSIEYYNENKEIICEKNKDYRIKNKETISEKRKDKYTCECGSCLRKSDKSRHESTQNHHKYIKSLIINTN